MISLATHRMRRWLAAFMAVACLLAAPLSARGADLLEPLGKLVLPKDAEPSDPSEGLNWARVLAGFAVTSGIRYALGGLGPAALLPMLSGLGPAAGVGALLGISLLEAGISISAFQLIAGIKTTERNILAFMLAAGSTALLGPLLLSSLGPVASTLIVNAGRLVLFNLIARNEDEKFSIGVGPLALTFGRDEAQPSEASGAAPEDLLLPELTQGMPRDLLEGELAELHAEVLRRQAAMAEASAGPSAPIAYESYAAAKRSLDSAIRKALR